MEIRTKDIPNDWELDGSRKSILTQKVSINTVGAETIEMFRCQGLVDKGFMSGNSQSTINTSRH
jgi:hypothetical protein